LFPHFICRLETKVYICSMKKELGKWLMDIAKYMATALLLSSAFGDMGNIWVIISVIIATALTLFSGLLLVRNKKEEKEV
jgi:amino acid permease